jgi:hypothetical protein
MLAGIQPIRYWDRSEIQRRMVMILFLTGDNAGSRKRRCHQETDHACEFELHI